MAADMHSSTQQKITAENQSPGKLQHFAGG